MPVRFSYSSKNIDVMKPFHLFGWHAELKPEILSRSNTARLR